jgi:hypothetical protein
LDDVTLATIHYKSEDFDENIDFPALINDDFITERNWD